MSSAEMASATKPSLAQDWAHAFRYWLRGRKGVALLVVLAVVTGAALNWSWLVAAGMVPLLLAVLPCAAMCGLGLCMNKMRGGSCSTTSTEQHPSEMSTPSAASEPDREGSVSLTAQTGALPDQSPVDAVEPLPDHRPRALNERK